MPLVTSALPGFAQVADLEARLGRTFDTPAARTQAEVLLGDATAHLQSLIGQQVMPGTSTVVLYAGQDDVVTLPQRPVRAVTSVRVGQPGAEASTGFYLDGHDLHLTAPLVVDPRRVLVTYDHGYLVTPPELVSWAIVLASQALRQIEQGGALGSAGLQSERVDDYAANFATSGDAALAFHVPQAAAERLRARYGGGVYVTGSR